MSAMMTVPCWEVYVWRGHWQLRSRHDTPQTARLEVLVTRHRDRFLRMRIVEAQRRVATYVQAPRPTEAQRFREQQAERQVTIRQARSYYKSGSNGTELQHPVTP